MNICGIISEYNPFHSGHAYQIAETKKQLGDCAVVAVMSGNYVQRAEPAQFDKWCRARCALNGGVNLVLELPTVYSVASAPSFAFGAISLLRLLGCVTHLSFGSECGDLEKLKAPAETLLLPQTDLAIKEAMKRGISYAAARELAVADSLGSSAASLLKEPNHILGVEYLKALRLQNASITPITILRQGQGHDETGPSQSHISATAARKLLALGDWDKLRPYLLSENLELYRAAAQNGLRSRPASYEIAVFTALRRMRPMDYLALPDVSEGIEERIVRGLQSARSLEELCQNGSTKRYPVSRIRRIALCALLGISREMPRETPCYARVLALDGIGRSLLKTMQNTAALPVVTKTADMPAACIASFGLECRATDLYRTMCDQIQPCGEEYTRSPYYDESK